LTSLLFKIHKKVMGIIAERVRSLLAAIPEGVTVVAAAKARSAPEIEEAIDAGIRDIGENYLQESRPVIGAVGPKARWHFIGHVQKNKVRHVVGLFDMIQTVDSLELASLIDRQAGMQGRVMPVLVEINSGREANKHGVMPEEAAQLVKRISGFPNVRVKGLMTMGPFLEDLKGLRPYFRETKTLFDEIARLKTANVDMEVLSMGMSDSFDIALEEGATMVRIGTLIFGGRPS
jgi:pyridoxal phosphate enzyme (YggS family)